MSAIVKRSARAILFDDHERLVLIRRVRPGEAPYWTAPGGGVEADDASAEAAMRRELREELGADADTGEQVFLYSSPAEGGTSVQHFFACRLNSLDLSQRSGPEFEDTSRGQYDLDFVSMSDGKLAEVDLKPPALKEFILANQDALLAAAAVK